MDENAPASDSRRLEEELSRLAEEQERELSRIRHEDPTWWVTDDTLFEKKGLARSFNHNEEAIAEEARKTGWRPLNFFQDDKCSSAPTHMALQQMGIGVGHPDYSTMLAKYHPSTHSSLTKKEFAEKFASHVPEATTRAASYRDVLSMAIARDITEDYYKTFGKPAMEDKESRDRQFTNEKYEDLKMDSEVRYKARDEVQVPPKRLLPWDEAALQRAKRARIDQGGYSMQNTAAAWGSRRAPTFTGRERRTFHIGLLEKLMEELRDRGRQFCDLDELVFFVTEESNDALYSFDPLNAGAEP